jgi:hypothetical protein
MASESQPPNFENYKTAVRKSVEQVVTLQDLTKLTSDLEDLKMDAFSDKLCLIRREKKDDVESPVLVIPITDHIKSRLANSMRSW